MRHFSVYQAKSHQLIYFQYERINFCLALRALRRHFSRAGGVDVLRNTCLSLAQAVIIFIITQRHSIAFSNKEVLLQND